jgi:uncharacterized membrane protein YfcA
MYFDATTAIILSVTFVSMIVRTVFGFGNALIAMPIFAMLIDIRVATPFVAFVGGVHSVYILFKDWRNVNLRSSLHLLVSSALGIPIGLLFLKGAYETVIKVFLAIVIFGYASYSLAKPRLVTLKSDRLAYLFGFIAGILGGAYNTNGPPVVIYGALRKWPPRDFRVILQGYFLPTTIFVIIGHGLGGLWTQEVFRLTFLSLPVVVLSILAGNRLHRAIPQARFDQFIHVFLILVAVLLLVRSVWN